MFVYFHVHPFGFLHYIVTGRPYTLAGFLVWQKSARGLRVERSRERDVSPVRL